MPKKVGPNKSIKPMEVEVKEIVKVILVQGSLSSVEIVTPSTIMLSMT